MAQPTKQLSSPFATGGGGNNFETRVQAAFTVLMLTGGVAPCPPAWPIERIKLQGRHAGVDTDDMIVYQREPGSDREGRLLVQIKLSVGMTKRDRAFSEVIGAAWRDFSNPSAFQTRH